MAAGRTRDGQAGVALLSGGLDSSVAAALFRAATGPLLAGLFVDYGQRAEARERQAAAAVAAALDAPLVVTRVDLLAEVTTTALVDRRASIPHPDPERLDAEAPAGADAVWVPNRNGVLVNLAAALAEARGAAWVVVGFNAEEAATFPDNGPRFVESLNAALRDSTRGRVAVAAPTLAMTKAQVWAAGVAAGLSLDVTWSCYEGGARPCGRCESCRRRERARHAAQQAGGR